MHRFFLFLFSFSICLAFSQKKVVDTSLVELQKLQEQNNTLRSRDSLKAELLKEELRTLINPKSKEIDRYKKELEKIKQTDSLRKLELRKKVEALRSKIVPYPVVLFQNEVFKVYSGLGPFTADVRAENASQQILDLYQMQSFTPDSLKINKNQDYSNIIYQGKIITSISQEDAVWNNIEQDSLAKRYLVSIGRVIEENKISHSPQNQFIRWMKVFAIAFFFWLMVVLLRYAFRYILKKMLHFSKVKKTGIKIRNYQFISHSNLFRIVMQGVKLLHNLLLFLFLYISLSGIFSVFPATQQYANMLLRFVWRPVQEVLHSIYAYLPNVVHIILFAVIGRYLTKLLRYISLEIKRGHLKISGFYPDWATPTYKLLRFVLIAFTIVLIFPYLPGASSDAFKGASVFFGVLISFGSSAAIANTIAGFLITYMRPFKLGDWIKVTDITGEVVYQSLLVTRLRTFNQQEVTLPNSMILINKTINYSSSAKDKGLAVSVLVNLRYEISDTLVRELLTLAAKETKDIALDLPIYVLKNGLKDVYISYQLYAFTRFPENMFFIESALNDQILKVFQEAGVDMISPQFFPK